MEKFYWNPTREDRVGVCMGIFQHDNVDRNDVRRRRGPGLARSAALPHTHPNPLLQVEKLVDAFPGQSIDFFGALRARVYDDKVPRPPHTTTFDQKHEPGKTESPPPPRAPVAGARLDCRHRRGEHRQAPGEQPRGQGGVREAGDEHGDADEGTLQTLQRAPPHPKSTHIHINSLTPPPLPPARPQYGNLLVEEQENVKRVQLANEYLDGGQGRMGGALSTSAYTCDGAGGLVGGGGGARRPRPPTRAFLHAGAALAGSSGSSLPEAYKA